MSLWQLTHPVLVLESTDVNKEWTGRAPRCWTSTSIVRKRFCALLYALLRRRDYELASGQ